MQDIVRDTLCGGMPVLIQPIASARSVAVCWQVPVGAAGDPDGRHGISTMLAEMLLRGAGGRTSRELSEAFDQLGVQRDTHVNTHHLELTAVLVTDKLAEALPLLADVIRRPQLAQDSVEPVRSLRLQAIESLQDDPQHRVMLELRRHHLPTPLNRNGYGDGDAIRAITHQELLSAWQTRATPGGSILAVAGGVAPAEVIESLGPLLDGWSGSTPEAESGETPARGVHHIEEATSQVHVGIAYDAPAEPDETSMLERLAVSVLSGGMSGRLFTEVRERRSLCYSVGARYSAGRDFGLVALYAGTTPERAQETLEVCLAEVERLREGVTKEEFHRAVTGLKSRLVMQGESTSARAGALARDQFRIGRPRTLAEMTAEIDGITLDQLNAYLVGREPGELTVSSIGPTVLKLPTMTS